MGRIRRLASLPAEEMLSEARSLSVEAAGTFLVVWVERAWRVDEQGHVTPVAGDPGSDPVSGVGATTDGGFLFATEENVWRRWPTVGRGWWQATGARARRGPDPH